MSPPEPRNPLYLLLLVAGLVFVVTLLACVGIPILEQQAIDRGEPPPPSAFRDALRRDGWLWVLVELAVLVALAVASMVVDWQRSLQKQREQSRISPDRRAEQ
jgi:hypothetical protein